jgi:hypothetical protein
MPETCLAEGCEKQVYARGLCPSCYHSCRRFVALGRTTWEELEEAGLARKPLSRHGRASKIFASLEEFRSKQKK